MESEKERISNNEKAGSIEELKQQVMNAEKNANQLRSEIIVRDSSIKDLQARLNEYLEDSAKRLGEKEQSMNRVLADFR